MTLPSGRRIAVEWYMRCARCVAMSVHLSAAGSYSYTMPIGYQPGASPQKT